MFHLSACPSFTLSPPLHPHHDPFADELIVRQTTLTISHCVFRSGDGGPILCFIPFGLRQTLFGEEVGFFWMLLPLNAILAPKTDAWTGIKKHP